MKGRKEGRTKITRHADGRYRPIDMNYEIRRRRPGKQQAENENMIESAENGHRDVHLRGVIQWNRMCAIHAIQKGRDGEKTVGKGVS